MYTKYTKVWFRERFQKWKGNNRKRGQYSIIREGGDAGFFICRQWYILEEFGAFPSITCMDGEGV